MLLKRCHILGFGKLQDFTYDFSEGFNLICTENGWGKSTFAAFLRAMFYGLPQTTKKNLDEAERKKYKPWNGGVMGGSLVFEVNGKEYRAERTFGKKEAEDTFRLIDLSTNLESGDFSAELGKELFGLDKEAYSRSTYLPQNRIFVDGMNDSIARKLGKMAEGEDDGGNYEKAYEILEELRKKYIPDRQKDEKGYVAELKKEMTKTGAKLAKCRESRENAKKWRELEQKSTAQRKDAEAKLALCREKLAAAMRYEAYAERKKSYTGLLATEEKLRVRKESMQGLFRVGVPDLSELRQCRHEAEEASVLSGELRSYYLDMGELRELEEFREKFGDDTPSDEDIRQCIQAEREMREALRRTEEQCRTEESAAKQAKRKKKTGICLLVIALVLAAAFAGIGLLHGKNNEANTTQAAVAVDVQVQENAGVSDSLLWFAGAGCCLLLGLFFAGSVLKQGSVAKNAERRQGGCVAEIDDIWRMGARGRQLQEKYGPAGDTDVTGCLYRLAEELQRYEVLAEKQANRERCMGKREALLHRTKELLARYGFDGADVSGQLHILENRTEEFVRISAEYADAAKKREDFEGENPPEEFMNLTVPEESCMQLQQEERELTELIDEVSKEEKDCRDRAEDFEETAEVESETEALYAELSERAEAKQREHDLIVRTRDCLKQAKESFSSRYLRGLATGFGKYVALLGDEDLSKSMAGHLDSVQTDIDLNVQITAYGEQKELGYFSTGTKDLMGLCMRFALVDAMFSEERPFLVLDDPFVNLDKEKTERAVRFLKETADNYQILYLVCHESRA